MREKKRFECETYLYGSMITWEDEEKGGRWNSDPAAPDTLAQNGDMEVEQETGPDPTQFQVGQQLSFMHQ